MYLRAGALALSSVFLLLSTSAVAAEEPAVPVEQLIDEFVANETAAAKSRQQYTYRQTVKMTEYNEGGKPGGRWELVQDIIFDSRNRRTERVVYAPVVTLRRLQLSPQDEQDLRDVQPFVMTSEERQFYDVDYLGEETIDEIDCHVFSVKPKELEKGKRYFQGQVWVDKVDVQIVKTYGKGVGFQKKNSDEQFPAFETFRQQIDGAYWFPVYTYADDTLQFRDGNNVRIKFIVKYEDYKKFGADTTITFGDEIVDDAVDAGAAEPEQ
jgi:hypothetical protein